MENHFNVVLIARIAMAVTDSDSIRKSFYSDSLLLLEGFFISWIIALLKSVMERKEI